jgi:hypothetical protein
MPATFTVSSKYDYLTPTDVVNVHGIDHRLTGKRNVANGVIEFDAVQSSKSVWTQGPAAVAGSGFNPSQPPTLQVTTLTLLDVPLILDTDEPNGIYVAAAGAIDTSWRGFTLFRSSDSGITYSNIGTATRASAMGAATTVLDDFLGGNVFDERNSVTVVIGAGGGTLASATALAVLNGANVALLGDELLQFKNADLVAANTYVLTGLLRGRRGTEWAMDNHVEGDRFVLMQGLLRAPMALSDLTLTRLYKPVSFGGTLAAATAIPFVSRGAALRPYAPASLGGGCNASGDVVINWIRRTRVGGAWSDFTDVALSEPSESYVLQVWNSDYTLCARVVTGLTSPTFTYTSAMQTTDFGGNQEHVFVTVGQLGSFGLGTQASATIPGAGGSDDAPLSPVTPYNFAPPTGGGTGAGCSGTVIPVTRNWATPGGRIFTGDDFGGDNVWLIKFTVAAGPWAHAAGAIDVAEWNGPPTPRIAVLSTEPCGAPVPPTTTIISNTARVKFYVRDNPFPGIYPTLIAGQTYYFSVSNSGGVTSGMYNDFASPA